MKIQYFISKILIILTAFVALEIGDIRLSYAQDKNVTVFSLEKDFSTCVDKTSTAEQIECIGKTHEQADKLLNIYYKALMKKLPPPNADELKSSQRRWVAQFSSLNKQLEKNYQEDPGTEQRLLGAAASCNFVLNRAGYLEMLLDNNIPF